MNHFNKIHDVKQISNLKDLLYQSESLYGNKSAFSVKDDKSSETYRNITYTNFRRDVDALGTIFFNMGLENDKIAVIGENRYEWCVTYIAAACGNIIVPLDKELPINEIENLLRRSDARCIVYSGKLSEQIKKLNNLPSLKHFICMDNSNDTDKFISYKNLIEKGTQLLEQGDKSFIDHKIDNEKLSILLFTSGTTDLAKGVMLSHKNICSDIMSIMSTFEITSNDSVLSILPLHHTYECTSGFLSFIFVGAKISFCEGLKHIPKNLKETKPTIVILVPLIIEGIYKKLWEHVSKKRSLKIKLQAGILASKIIHSTVKIDIRSKIFKPLYENFGGNIRFFMSGAAAINPEVSKGFRDIGIKILQGYGLTEASPIITCNSEFVFNDKSIGIAIPGVEVKIHNPDSTGIGEIIAKGNNIMLGYFDNETETKKVLKDGWLYTGDLGYKDDNGFFYITGRKKNVIVTKNGKNIFPEEVEAYLNKSDYILESLVSGSFDETSGETYVTAQIVPDFEVIKEKLKIDKSSKEEIHKIISSEVKSINKCMPLYKHIRQFIIKEDEFIKTTTKKIKRYANNPQG